MNQQNIYQQIFNAIKDHLKQSTPFSNELAQLTTKFGLKKDFQFIIERIKVSNQLDHSELLQTLKYAQQIALYGFDCSMIDTLKRSPQQNLRAFMIQLSTKTLKLLAEQLLTAQRTFKKAMDGQIQNNNQNNPNSQKNIITLSKNIHNMATKIANNMYSIQKVQPNKQEKPLDNNKQAKLQQSIRDYQQKLQKIQAQFKNLRSKYVIIEVENILLNKKVGGFKSTIEGAQSQNKELKSKLIKLEEQRQQLLKSNAAKKDQQQNINKLSLQINQLKKKVDTLSRQKSELTTLSNAQKMKHKQKLQKLQKLQHLNNQMKTQIAQQQQIINKNNEPNRREQQIKQNLEKENIELKTRLQISQQQKNDLTKILKLKQYQVIRLQQEKEKIKIQLQYEQLHIEQVKVKNQQGLQELNSKINNIERQKFQLLQLSHTTILKQQENTKNLIKVLQQQQHHKKQIQQFKQKIHQLIILYQQQKTKLAQYNLSQNKELNGQNGEDHCNIMNPSFQHQI